MAPETTADKKCDLLFIGLGNLYRHDDAVGLVVAERLQEAGHGCVKIMTRSGEGTDLIEAWKGANTVVLCDAIYSGAGPGTIFHLDVGRQPIPRALFRFSTHAFGVAEAVELARELGELPPRLTIYGIEGANFQEGIGLSPEVEAAAWDVVNALLSRSDVKSAVRAD